MPTFLDIKKIISKSTLSEVVKESSLQIFRILAEAEGKIHNKSPDQIHFHEVGAVDSIVDIVAASICVDYLKPDKIYSSSIELGGGFVKCEHGTIPVPAPATLEILKDVPVKTGAVPFETTTPTGAAILAFFVDLYTDKTAFIPKKIAYGIGHRDTDIPNVLRVIIFENIADSSDTSPDSTDEIVLECTIDDMNPEFYSSLIDRFLEAGAKDAYYTPVVMKKGRPGVNISVLAPLGREEAIGEIMLKETSTFGYRKNRIEKVALKRLFEIKDTSLGNVTVKTAFLNGGRIKSKVEYEDCLGISRKKGIPLPEVYRIINGELYESKNN
ncbi:MAG: nickel pincer cofactor biosynthesis protein LarC [Spirochaetales bacterium]|nr:nickel pincer cofactor biosynthesis protein LarC [Spirochaetales bacterium]